MDEYYGDKIYDKSENGGVNVGLGSFGWIYSDFSYSSQNPTANSQIESNFSKSLISNYFQSIDTYPP